MMILQLVSVALSCLDLAQGSGSSSTDSSSVTSTSAATSTSEDYAYRFHRWGMKIVTEGETDPEGPDYEQAVAYFRAAVRADPTSMHYLNDLGVTEMRYGDYLKSYSRFYKILSQNPNDSDALDNLRDLREYFPVIDEQLRFNSTSIRQADSAGIFALPHGALDGEAYYQAIVARQRHALVPLRVITAAEFMTLTGGIHQQGGTSAAMEELFAQPFRVTGMATELGWQLDQVTLETLLGRRLPQQQQYEQQQQQEEEGKINTESETESTASGTSPNTIPNPNAGAWWSQMTVDFYPQSMCK